MQRIGGNVDTKIAGLYDLGETLGSGHFAVVKLAKHVFTGEKVAVKVVDKTKLDEVSRAHLFQEVRCMKLVQHPHVVRLYEVIDTQTKLYLVLEWGDGGDLYDYIMKHEGGLSEELAKKYFGQIVRAISYCHQLHVVHRDLKAENVVFFEKLGVVKLTDFGFSNKFCPGQKLETSCGSLAYSAPEILLGDSYDAPAVDIWSLGVILYMLVCGQLPFEKANDSETLTMIMDCKYTFPQYLSSECKSLISSMLVRDPTKRSTLAQIADHPWLRGHASITETSTNSKNIPDYQPLVSREQVNEEDHKFIIQKMINGNVATKEDILSALDRDKYNHITATYFLLAERKLRQKRNEALQHSRKADNPSTGGTSSKPMINKFDPNKLTVPTRADVQAALTPIEDFSGVKRNRKCSIVREEEDDEEEFSDGVVHSDSSSTFSRRGSKSEGRLNLLMQKVVLKADDEGKMFKNGVCPMTLSCKDDTKIITNTTTKSLDEIEIADNQAAKSSSKPRNLPTIRRNKLIQIRTPSCSSSEASDDDTKARKKKSGNMNDVPSRFHYRDSHDDSSDSQEQPNHFANSSARIPKRHHQQQQQQQQQQQNSSGNEKQQQQQQHNSKEKTNTRNKKHENLRQMRSRARRHTTSRHKESQSLDRICESHEYGAGGNEFSHSVNSSNTIGNKRNSISGTCATIDVDEINPKFKSAQSDTNITNLLHSAIIEDELFFGGGGGDHDVDDGGKTKAIIGTHTTKYSRAFKKITQLKRYFLINFP